MLRYGCEERCEAQLIASRRPQRFSRPKCGQGARRSFRREGRSYWQCQACPHQCSVRALTSGAIFEGTELPLSRWFLAVHLLTQAKNSVSALELNRHLGVCYRTAWLIGHKLMEVRFQREESRQLTGRVEIDDACLGGERSGGKAGRGSENKVPFIAAGQTAPGGKQHLACFSASPLNKESVREFMATSTVLPLTVVSDGLGCFK